MIALLVDYETRWRMHDDDGVGWVMVLLMLLLVAAVVVAVIAFVRGSSALAPPASRPAGTAPAPRAILQERFARGEIDEDDFRARMRALDESGG